MKNKDYVLYVIPILVVIVITMGIFSIINNFNNNRNVLLVDYFGNQDILISNTLPMTDVIGKSITLDNHKTGITGYLEFEVKSTVGNKIKYNICLKKSDIENEIPSKFVKIYLTDDNNNVLGKEDYSSVLTYYDLNEYSSTEKLLYSGVLKGKETKKFKLRIWVADTYELTHDEKNFSIKLDVKQK